MHAMPQWHENRGKPEHQRRKLQRVVLELRGGMNGWGAGDAFAPDLTDPNLYVLEKTIEASPDSEIMWKFHARPLDPEADAPFTNGGWEVGADHVLAFTGEDMMLDPMAPRIFITGAFANDVTFDLHVEWREMQVIICINSKMVLKIMKVFQKALNVLTGHMVTA